MNNEEIDEFIRGLLPPGDEIDALESAVRESTVRMIYKAMAQAAEANYEYIRSPETYFILWLQ